jgi:hypothetical protein
VPYSVSSEAAMANPAGESNDGVLKLDFDRRLTVQFRGSVVTSDAGVKETIARIDHSSRLQGA